MSKSILIANQLIDLLHDFKAAVAAEHPELSASIQHASFDEEELKQPIDYIKDALIRIEHE